MRFQSIYFSLPVAITHSSRTFDLHCLHSFSAWLGRLECEVLGVRSKNADSGFSFDVHCAILAGGSYSDYEPRRPERLSSTETPIWNVEFGASNHNKIRQKIVNPIYSVYLVLYSFRPHVHRLLSCPLSSVHATCL